MKASYECSELIEELKQDIAEFGDIDLYAFFEKVDGYTFLTNYDFIEEEKPLTANEFTENTKFVVVMKASEILKKFEEQNETL